ncbi:MAG: hypothetical protein NVSMB13_04750 [Mycobacteriales bacterium]
MVARLGGDEFTVLMTDVSTAEAPIAAAERIRAALLQVFRLGGHEVFIGASVGISRSDPDHPVEPNELMRRADVAMYAAKERGHGGWHCYSADLDGASLQRLSLETDLRHALDRKEFRIAYQPVVSIATGALVGVEALLRWDHPVRGAVSPDVFVPLAEDSGLIVRLGAWVLNEVCAQASRWQADVGRPSAIAVNVSARQLAAPEFMDTLDNALNEHGAEPDWLVLEITERVVLAGEEVRRCLEDIRRRGVRLSIDDFGQGQSSLTYLRSFQVDEVKIDKTFVHGCDGAEPDQDRAIVRAMVDVSHALGMRVTAEGVETTSQLDYLTSVGVDSAQGYLFHLPMTGDALTTLLGAATGGARSTKRRRRPLTSLLGEVG